MLWLLEPRWYGVCAIVGLLTGTAGFYQGYKYADKSAQITALEQTVKTANASIDALQESARRANQAAAAFTAREVSDTAAEVETQGQVDVITTHEETRPASDICRLDAASVASLRELALRATGAGNPSPPASIDIRPAGRSSAPPRQ